MSFAAVVTIICVVLTVLALAGYLIYVALLLRRAERRLSRINAGIEAITGKARPAGPVVREINQALAGVNSALQAVLTKKRPPKHQQQQQQPAAQTSSRVLGSDRPPQVVTRPAARVDPFSR